VIKYKLKPKVSVKLSLEEAEELWKNHQILQAELRNKTKTATSLVPEKTPSIPSNVSISVNPDGNNNVETKISDGKQSAESKEKAVQTPVTPVIPVLNENFTSLLQSRFLPLYASLLKHLATQVVHENEQILTDLASSNKSKSAGAELVKYKEYVQSSIILLLESKEVLARFLRACHANNESLQKQDWLEVCQAGGILTPNEFKWALFNVYRERKPVNPAPEEEKKVSAPISIISTVSPAIGSNTITTATQ